MGKQESMNKKFNFVAREAKLQDIQNQPPGAR